MLPPLDEHHLLVFWTQLFVLLAVARLFGHALRRIGLPTIVGQLLAGVVLGPSVFGRLWPDGFAWFLPDDDLQGGLLLAVGWVGIALVLVVTGFETDLRLIGRLGRSSALVSVSSIVVPLAAGLTLGALLPDSLFGDEATRLSFTLFVGAALAVSSLAVVAKILGELGFMRRDFGQITVAAGMANDVVGWLLLGGIAAVAAEGAFRPGLLLRTTLLLAVMVVLAFTVGQRGIDVVLRLTRRRGENLGAGVAVVALVALGFAVITQWIGVEGVLGAFLAGILLGRSRFQQEKVVHHVETVTSAFLAPVFFATAGLRVDLGVLVDDGAVGWAALLVAVALVAKFVGAYGGAMLAGLTQREGVALGAGLNARGALEIVIATVGLSLAVLDTSAYTAVVLVPIVTSVVAAVGLRLTVRGWPGTEAEQQRLARERALAANLVVRDERLLVPTRGGPNSIVAAQLLHCAWPEESGVTLVRLDREGHPPADLTPITNVLHGREVEVTTVPWENAAAEVDAQSRLGFGVIGIGVNDAGADRGLLSPLAEQLVGTVDVPIVLARRARHLDRALPGAFARAVVPVTGSPSSRAAQEVAFAIAEHLGTDVVLVHVVERPRQRRLARLRGGSSPRPPAADIADELLADATRRARDHGIEPGVETRHASSPARELVRVAEHVDADLIVVGASARPTGGSTFLGHTVEQVLDESDATVAVVISPPPRTERDEAAEP